MSGYSSAPLSRFMPQLLVHSQANIWLDRKKGEALFARQLPQNGVDKDDLYHTDYICRSMNVDPTRPANQCHCFQCHSKLVARPSQSSFTLKCSNSRENLYLPSRLNGPRGLPRGRSYSGHHVSHPQSDQCILLSRERPVSRRGMIARNSFSRQLLEWQLV